MKIGFIGMGHMGRAMSAGAVSAFGRENISFFVPDQEHGKQYAAELKLKYCPTYAQAADTDLLVLAIKPQVYRAVADALAPVLKENTIVISPAPGISIARLSDILGGHTKIARIMPNTPAFVGEGMTGVTFSQALTQEEKESVEKLLTSFGKYGEVNEDLMDAVVCVSGSSPAYVYIFIEALADSAVKYGIKRDVAVKMAAQTVLGSAKMVLESGEDPAVLKNAVCSPGGTTIQGVSALEEQGFRNAIIKATDACYKKCTEIK